jgi:predicted CoA-binding protein
MGNAADAAADAITDDELRRILAGTRVVAVVGVSADPLRPSHAVASHFAGRGIRVIPVNPAHAGTTLFGEPVRAELADIPPDIPVDMVDIFRRSEQAGAIVDAALARLPGLRTIWMQIGVANPEAAARARARGIAVVQDRCPKIEYQRLRASGAWADLQRA